MNPAPKPAANSWRSTYKRWTLFAILAAFLIRLIIGIATTPPATPNAVSISFLGYTNPPGNHWRFAQFSISNLAAFTIRWRGSGVEIEGRSNYQAQVINPNLPTYTCYRGQITATNPPTGFGPTLEPGQSLRLAIGEPSEDNDGPVARWRYSMFFSRYILPQRYYDLAALHHWPLRLGPILLVDYRKFLSPTNNVTTSSPWLAK